MARALDPIRSHFLPTDWCHFLNFYYRASISTKGQKVTLFSQTAGYQTRFWLLLYPLCHLCFSKT
jgi:hypothetical protein